SAPPRARAWPCRSTSRRWLSPLSPVSTGQTRLTRPLAHPPTCHRAISPQMERKNGMRTDRPGYQYRDNRDGTRAHYWNPKRAVKGAPAALSAVRLPDGLSDEQIAAECQRRTNELKAELVDL